MSLLSLKSRIQKKIHSKGLGFFSQSLVYVMSNAGEALAAFLFLPILTKYLSQHEYGILSVYLVLSRFLILFVHMNVPTGVTMEYYHGDARKFSDYVSATMFVPFFNAIMTCLVICLFEEDLVHRFQVSGGALYMLPIFVLLQFVPGIYLSVCQVEKKANLFARFKLSGTVLNFLLALLFVAWLDQGWIGQPLGFAWGFAVYSVLAFIFLVRKKLLRWHFDWSIVKKAYSFGFIVFFHSVSAVIISMADRIIIQDIKGYNEVGVYAVAYQVGTVLTIVATGIAKALVPNTYENLKIDTPESHRRIVRQVYVMMGLLAAVSLLLLAASDLLFGFLVDKSFGNAKPLLLPLIPGLLFQGFYMLKSNMFFYFNKSGLLAFLTVSSAVINIVLNYMLIPVMGTVGAAYATLITYFLFWIITWFMLNRMVRLPWFSFHRIRSTPDSN
jgi:O-antigen/teichoic acid export membrane protein